MAPSLFILHVSADPSLLQTRTLILQSAGHIVQSTTSVDLALQRIRDWDFDAVVLGHTLGHEARELFVTEIRQRGSTTPVIFVDPDLELKSITETGVIAAGTEPVTLLRAVEEAAGRRRP